MAGKTKTIRFLTGVLGLGLALTLTLLEASSAAQAQAGDGDADGLDDAWETIHFGDLSQDGTDDPDGDGYDNAYEMTAGTDPLDPADPPNPDSDGDGLDDAWELAYFGDLSQDGSGDPDVDSCDNAREETAGTDPTNPDSDGDGLTDGYEIGDGSDPLDSADPPDESTSTTTSASTTSTTSTTQTSSTSNTPAFWIEEWYTSPSALERGSEFDLGLTITNVGTSKAKDVLITIDTSTDFFNVGDIERLSSLGVDKTKDVVLRVGIAPDLAEGYHAIPVEISGYDVDAKTRVTETRSISVFVEGLSADASTSAFSIDSWTIQPEGLYAGAQFNLGVTFTNIGTEVAEEVLVTVGSSSDFVELSTSPHFGTIGVGETQSATLRVGVSDNIGDNYYVIPIEIGFNNNTGQGDARLTDTRNIGVYVAGGGTSSEVSEFFLERYGVVPDTISPGVSFQLQVVLVNRSSSSARQFFARLGQSSVLAPLGGSNVQYLEQVEAGSSITLAYDMVVDGGAEAGLTTIDLDLEYEDVYGSQQQQTETINLAVVETPYLQVGLYDDVPETVIVGDEFDIPVEVINIGSESVNLNTIEVVSPGLSITDGALYVGPLDSGSSGSLVASAEAVSVGPATVEVQIHYLDSLQQPQTITQTLTTVEVTSPAPVPLDEPTAAQQEKPKVLQQVWQAILGLLGLRTEQANEVTVIE